MERRCAICERASKQNVSSDVRDDCAYVCTKIVRTFDNLVIFCASVAMLIHDVLVYIAFAQFYMDADATKLNFASSSFALIALFITNFSEHDLCTKMNEVYLESVMWSVGSTFYPCYPTYTLTLTSAAIGWIAIGKYVRRHTLDVATKTNESPV
jgi:hypothetical protein